MVIKGLKDLNNLSPIHQIESCGICSFIRDIIVIIHSSKIDHSIVFRGVHVKINMELYIILIFYYIKRYGWYMGGHRVIIKAELYT